MLAYLVIREGSKWTDVFRLIPGQVGHHRPRSDQPDRHQRRALQPLPRRGLPVAGAPGPCATWKAATAPLVGSQTVRGDHALRPGDIIRIGQSQLVFVHDLSKAFPDSSHFAAARGQHDDETVAK